MNLMDPTKRRDRADWPLRLAFVRVATILAFLMMAVTPASAARGMPKITQVRVLQDSAGIKVILDGPAKFRAVLTEPREAMIAFKGVQISGNVQPEGMQGRMIQRIKIEQLPNSVVALIVKTTSDMRDIQSSWEKSVNTMTARLIFSDNDPRSTSGEEMAKPKEIETAKKTSEEKKRGQRSDEPRPEVPPKSAPTKPVKAQKKDKGDEKVTSAKNTGEGNQNSTTPAPGQKSEEKMEQTADGETDPASTSTILLPSSTSVRNRGAMVGGTDDLPLVMGKHPCKGKINITEALVLCAAEDWRKAYRLLDEGIQQLKGDDCLECAYYLRAYTHTKMNQKEDAALYLDSLSYFQDAISYYPTSIYAPFALASIGKIYMALKNYSEAKGYFKIITNTYKEYSGKPEVLCRVGMIHAAEKKLDLSISAFRNFLTDYPDSAFVPDVKVELGKALFDANRFSEALELLTAVLANDPAKAFEDSEIMSLIGNCHYQLGRFEAARDALARAINLFPTAESNSTSLTRIGDMYRDTKQPEKASKIYQLVLDLYPKTDGFIISSIRKAELVEDRSEKEKILKTVIAGYSSHPVAKLALVKLADIQCKSGEYRNSIETIRPVVAARKKELDEEAVFIMQSAFEGLITEMSGSNAYTEIIALYQKESGVLRRFNNANLFKLVGEAYAKGHLHAEAATIFKKALKLYGSASPPELTYELALALESSGETTQALAELQKYVQLSPKGEHLVDAFCRMGRILIAQEDSKGALLALNSAKEQNPTSSEKIMIFRLLSIVHRMQGEFEKAAGMLNAETELLVSGQSKDADALSEAYQQLGECYLQTRTFEKAINAFKTALSYRGEVPSPSILVQLGEAYRKTGDTDNAKKMFDQVMTLDDDFWKAQAQERLRRLTIENRIRREGV